MTHCVNNCISNCNLQQLSHCAPKRFLGSQPCTGVSGRRTLRRHHVLLKSFSLWVIVVPSHALIFVYKLVHFAFNIQAWVPSCGCSSWRSFLQRWMLEKAQFHSLWWCASVVGSICEMLCRSGRRKPGRQGQTASSVDRQWQPAT